MSYLHRNKNQQIQKGKNFNKKILIGVVAFFVLAILISLGSVIWRLNARDAREAHAAKMLSYENMSIDALQATGDPEAIEVGQKRFADMIMRLRAQNSH